MNVIRMAVLVGVLAAAAAAASGAEVPKRESAADQLKWAVSVERRSHKKSAAEKKAILAEAIEAFSKVKEYFPEDRKQCATAALRIGNLHRSLREADKALAAYQEALVYSEETRTAAMALEQIAHLQRRQNRLDEATASYRTVAERFAAEGPIAARSLVWSAKCELKKKNVSGARETLRQMIERFPDEAGTVIDAFDLLATTFVQEKKIAEAESVLRECREMFKEQIDGEGQDDDGVKRDIERMRAPKLIERERGRLEASTARAVEEDDDREE
jgi:tetratricopeptide (TPR) repeat protein